MPLTNYYDSGTTSGVWYDTSSYTASSSDNITISVWATWNASANTNTTVWADWNTTYNIIDEPLMAAPTPATEDQVAAEQRAEALLRSFLTPDQEASYFDPARRYFDLTVEGGNRPARHYRIRRGVAGNIKRLEDGREVESLCVHPAQMPTPDINLCQLLELTHREEEYRKIANITRLVA